MYAPYFSARKAGCKRPGDAAGPDALTVQNAPTDDAQSARSIRARRSEVEGGTFSG